MTFPFDCDIDNNKDESGDQGLCCDNKIHKRRMYIMKNIFGKILRVLAIIFMAMTTFMNLMGGIGTSCAAFFTKNYPSFSALMEPVDYRWLYQLFVVVTVAVGIAGIVIIIGLIRGG